MGRPKGHKLSPESRQRIADGMRRRQLALIAGDADAFRRESRAITARLVDLMGAVPESARDDARYVAAVDEAIGRVLLALGQAMEEDMERDDPYAGIPSIQEMAAARRAVANSLQGERLGDNATPHIKKTRAAASPVFVGDRETRHAPMTGSHSHDHAAYGEADHDDGIHSHVHTHSGDAMHDHTHGRGQ